MKKFGLILLIISIIGVIIGGYCQFILVPIIQNGMITDAEWQATMDRKFLLGTIALGIGILTGTIGIGMGFRGNKMGWLILITGAISFVLGAMTSTHMFS